MLVNLERTFASIEDLSEMSVVHTDDTVAIWSDHRGVPQRLVWRGERYQASDDPTPLEDILLGAVTHPRAIQGWRFQGTDQSGESLVFDVLKRAHSNEWALVNVYE